MKMWETDENINGQKLAQIFGGQIENYCRWEIKIILWNYVSNNKIVENRFYIA